MFKIKIDNRIGIPNYIDTSKGYSLQTCFNLDKLTGEDRGKALMFRLYAHVQKFEGVSGLSGDKIKY